MILLLFQFSSISKVKLVHISFQSYSNSVKLSSLIFILSDFMNGLIYLVISFIFVSLISILETYIFQTNCSL
ncbi:hypothetical protein HOF65_03275 [bacterium]|nr:hypothetical protein [bacterium]